MSHPTLHGWIAGVADDRPGDTPFQGFLEMTADPYSRVFLGSPRFTRQAAEAELDRFLETASYDDLSAMEQAFRERAK